LWQYQKEAADIKLDPDADGSMVSLSQSLCLTCGLCCDGALFSSVRLKPDDEVTPLKAAGINFVSNGDSNEFKQPCAAHKNCTCAVYANRPQECRTYKCELLKRFERNDISHGSALEIINKMISLKNEVNALARAASTNTQSAEEINSLIKKWSRDRSIGATKQGYAHVFLKFGVLQIYLDRFFRNKPILTPHISDGDSPSKPTN
jgi:Fe-S-cluster containining protein